MPKAAKTQGKKKSGRTRYVAFRLEEDAYERLRDFARSEDRTISVLIRRILRRALDRPWELQDRSAHPFS
jgi:predicted DNA-binding protein